MTKAKASDKHAQHHEPHSILSKPPVKERMTLPSIGIERLCARIVTAMMSLEARKAVPLPQALRDAIESYRQRTKDGGPP